MHIDLRALCLSAALTLSACQTAAVAPSNAGAASSASSVATPYFDGAAFDVASILPGPPPNQSPLATADLDAVRAAVSGATPERRALAIADADLNISARFASALGRELSADQLPATTALFRRVYANGARIAANVKARFGRVRPLVADESITFCWPEQRPAYTRDLSYPSGHSMWGWSTALILAEMVPERAEALLARGREIGDSRVICGVHYPSDVDGGRIFAAAWVARLQAEPQFAADIAAARRELRAALGLPAAP